MEAACKVNTPHQQGIIDLVRQDKPLTLLQALDSNPEDAGISSTGTEAANKEEEKLQTVT